MKKILIIFGTRPEAIKFAPVIRELKRQASFFETYICDTGQHQELKQPVLDFFDIQPHYTLNALQFSNSLSSLSAYLINALPGVIEATTPDWILVQGDTASAFAGSLAGFYAKVRVAHIEAGLRTHQKWAPYPEEMNRQLIGKLADLHFAPTASAVEHLKQEGVAPHQIHQVGNTVVDALLLAIQKIKVEKQASIEALRPLVESWHSKYPKMILFTLHRRENISQNLPELARAMNAILDQSECFILFPAHLNPAIQQWAKVLASQSQKLLLVAPLAYEAFVWAMQQCALILTDSGGIQEEAPTLGKPVVVLRTSTERPEAQQSGVVRQVSVHADRIVSATLDLLQNTPDQPHTNPFGDGHASERILDVLRTFQE